MTNRRGKIGSSDRFYIWGLPNHGNGDYCHEMKVFASWKESLINLDNVLKSRDITLLTRVCIVKAMVFPVVMYGCDSWIKKAECQRIDALEL